MSAEQKNEIKETIEQMKRLDGESLAIVQASVSALHARKEMEEQKNGEKK